MKIFSSVLTWLFEKEYSVFELIAFMMLFTAVSNFWAFLGIGLVIVMVGSLLRGVSETLADRVKG